MIVLFHFHLLSPLLLLHLCFCPSVFMTIAFVAVAIHFHSAFYLFVCHQHLPFSSLLALSGQCPAGCLIWPRSVAWPRLFSHQYSAIYPVRLCLAVVVYRLSVGCPLCLRLCLALLVVSLRPPLQPFVPSLLFWSSSVALSSVSVYSSHCAHAMMLMDLLILI